MSFLKKTPYTFDSIVRTLISLFLIISLIFTLRVLRTVLLPFAIAFILSYLINPFIIFLETHIKGINRVIAVALGLTLIGSGLALFGYLLFPIISQEVNQIAILLKKHALNSSLLSVFPPEVEHTIRLFLKSENYSNMIDLNLIQDLWHKFTPRAIEFIHNSISLLAVSAGFITVFLYVVFILIDYNNVIQTSAGLIPPEYRKSIVEIIVDFNRSMNTYFRAQALIALLVGVLFAIGFYLIKLPFGISLGLFIGALNIVPYLQIIGFFPAIGLAYLKALEYNQPLWSIVGLVILVFFVVQVIQELILIPKIMKNATGMNPAFILLSLSIWGTLLGFLGLLIALPVTSVSLAYYKRYIEDHI